MERDIESYMENGKGFLVGLTIGVSFITAVFILLEEEFKKNTDDIEKA